MTDLYFCPTAREMEIHPGGGFTACCDRPELHIPVQNGPTIPATVQLLDELNRADFQTSKRVAELEAGGDRLARAADNLSRTLAAAQQRAEKAEAERDGAYRERAQLVALLAALYPATLAYNDPTAPEWAVVYVDLPTGQASWHVAPADVELFAHVHRDDSHEWDGHTTEEKYQRIAELADEQAGADRYAAMVNAPLRPETIAAINERLKAGDVPVRKVKARGADAES